MKLPDVAHWNLLALAVGDRDAKDPLTQKDSLGVVSKSAMPEIREKGLGLIEPVMYREIVLGPATELSGATLRVLEWVSHD
jgi:hypothetical protein